MLIVTCFRVVQTWQAWKVWKVIYSFQKSQEKTWMTVFLEEKKFVVFRKNAPQVCNFLNSFVQDCSYSLPEWQVIELTFFNCTLARQKCIEVHVIQQGLRE